MLNKGANDYNLAIQRAKAGGYMDIAKFLLHTFEQSNEYAAECSF